MTKINWQVLSEEQFSAYEEVRQSGETNMFDTPRVAELTDNFLTIDQVSTIISHYDELNKKYPLVRGSYA
tara:strand:- start:1815 stop:2024 length:210 start_codon:yes stop_codon:yes gene_type:complete